MFAQNTLIIRGRVTRLTDYLVLIILVVLVSCNSVDSLRAKSVCEVVENPEKYGNDEQVIVKGIVTESISFIWVTGFMLKDLHKDCTVGVKTDRIIPAEGKEIIVKGQLLQLYSIGTNRILVIEESNVN